MSSILKDIFHSKSFDDLEKILHERREDIWKLYKKNILPSCWPNKIDKKKFLKFYPFNEFKIFDSYYSDDLHNYRRLNESGWSAHFKTNCIGYSDIDVSKLLALMKIYLYCGGYGHSWYGQIYMHNADYVYINKKLLKYKLAGKKLPNRV